MAVVSTTYSQVTRPGFLGAEVVGSEQQVSNVAPAQATLVGNKGTVITLNMQIQAGNPPVGIGEGQDNHGKKYTIQF